MNAEDQWLIETAVGFIERLDEDDRSSEQERFSRAVRYLHVQYGCALAVAERLVTLAYGQLRSRAERRVLDVHASSSQVAVVTDPASGMTWAIPLALITERIIDSPVSRRLRLVSA